MNFASDNTTGASPEMLEALQNANEGQTMPYGEDEYTARVGDAIRFHPQFLELAGHYLFKALPCAPGRANDKGRVERKLMPRFFWSLRAPPPMPCPCPP